MLILVQLSVICPVFCVLNVNSVSGLSILDCPFFINIYLFDNIKCTYHQMAVLSEQYPLLTLTLTVVNNIQPSSYQSLQRLTCCILSNIQVF